MRMKHGNTALNIVPIASDEQTEKIENDDYSGQLRQLRLILGKNFRQISVRALADASGIPCLAIQSVEAGRRVLNEVDRESLKTFLGAYWSTESHSWVCSRDNATLYSRTEYVTHNSKMLNDSNLIKDNLKGLHDAIDKSLINLEMKEAVLVLIQLRAKLHEVSKNLQDKQE
jgi:hypothetical protein